jgi:hypothetical protein
MAEPTIIIRLNEGTEGTPTWAEIDTGARWVGPDAADGALTDPMPAPIADGDDVFFDNTTAPDDGELWNEKAGTDTHCTVAGRNGNQNVAQIQETGGTDPTADPPEFCAYDDATDGQNRTAPTVWLLTGTTGSSSISQIRAVETTVAAGSAGGWQAQLHDEDPQVTGTGVAADGYELDGDKAGEKVVCASVLALSGTKEFNLAACVPHDPTSTGETTFVYQCQYTYT